MKDKLKTIIEYAVENGWDGTDGAEWVVDEKDVFVIEIYNDDGSIDVQLFTLLFSHKFAKAVFGEEDMWKKTKCNCGGVDFHIFGHDVHKPDCARVSSDRGYKFHLQRAVISNSSIDYYYTYISNKGT